MKVTMKASLSKILTVLSISIACLAATSQAAVILSTNFTNTGVSGATMNGITWVENGLSAPSSITASVNLLDNPSGTGDAVGGYFAGNAQVNNTTSGSPAWSMTFTVTVGTTAVALSDLVLASAEINSFAVLGAGNGSSTINLNVVDNLTTLSIFNQSQNRTDLTGASQSLSYTPASPLTLAASNTYDITFTVWELVSGGSFEAFDSLTLNGEAIPEPSTALLGGLGMLLLLRRHR